MEMAPEENGEHGEHGDHDDKVDHTMLLPVLLVRARTHDEQALRHVVLSLHDHRIRHDRDC